MKMNRRTVCYVVICLILLEASLALSPNFIFFLTDDQDILLHGLRPMKKTLEFIADHGVVFENAFVNSPICCPSRSSILTGKYPHNIKVFNNTQNGNCSSRHWQQNFEKKNIANYLKTENYTTFYAGKYLNQYGSDEAGGVGHVPPGFDWWLGLKGNSRYYNYTLSINGTGKYFENDYLTDRIKNYAVEFLRLNHNKNFFMMLAPPACHAPFTAADRHLKKFPDVKAVRNPAFNFSSIGKHWIVSKNPEYLPSNVSILNDIQRKRLQTLLAVDEMVGELVQYLKKFRIYDDTYLIFTSDNGYHIGQFGQPWDKRQPYESDVRIPFMMSGPNIPKKKMISFPISAVDIAPTILDFAGISIPYDMDGASFKNQLKEQDFNKNILIEYWGEGNINKNDKNCPWISDQLMECRDSNWCKCQDSRNNTYKCIIQLSKNTKFKFCQFYDDLSFVEAYDLTSDPHELHNIYEFMDISTLNRYENFLDRMARCEERECYR